MNLGKHAQFVLLLLPTEEQLHALPLNTVLHSQVAATQTCVTYAAVVVLDCSNVAAIFLLLNSGFYFTNLQKGVFMLPDGIDLNNLAMLHVCG